MKKANRGVWILSIAFILAIALFTFRIANKEDGAPLSDIEEIAADAYIYGYPLITMEMTRRVSTNVERPEGAKAPMGQFANLREYPNASFKTVTAPNADTLYSVAWLDLSKEPYILSLPNEDGRYYLMPMLSGWTDVFESPGTRTTGTSAQTFAITGPGWTGELPQGIKRYSSPTNLAWIIGRTYCTGTAADYKAVHALQDNYQLIPLSFYGKPYTPPKGFIDPSVDMNTPVRTQVNSMDAETYFNRLAELMKDNPPSEEDAPMIEKMAKIGFVPGKPFYVEWQDPKVVEAIKNAPAKGLEKIKAHAKDAGALVNGWIYSTKTGTYGTDYLQRAYVSYMGLGANKPQDAIYPTSFADSKGSPYSGTNRYVLRFPKGGTPPVNGFWSLTMYNDEFFFVDNPLNRYSISPRDNLKSNPDGSIDIYIQNASPGKDKETNWLPAPKENFNLMFRFYWPKDALIDGKWMPPAVEKVQ